MAVRYSAAASSRLPWSARFFLTIWNRDTIILVPAGQLGGFRKEATHAPLRPHGRPMASHRAVLPRPLPLWWCRPPVEGPPPPRQRHPLAHAHRRPWPDVPERYGPWQTVPYRGRPLETVYDRFNRWRQDGTWARILDTLLLRLDKRGFIDRELWCVDASVIRASRAAAGAEKKSRPPTATGRVEANANAGAD